LGGHYCCSCYTAAPHPHSRWPPSLCCTTLACTSSSLVLVPPVCAPALTHTSPSLVQARAGPLVHVHPFAPRCCCHPCARWPPVCIAPAPITCPRPLRSLPLSFAGSRSCVWLVCAGLRYLVWPSFVLVHARLGSFVLLGLSFVSVIQN
jgi:hypothetical protein